MSVNPFSNAQVCCGGVDTREVDPDTMESRNKDGALSGRRASGCRRDLRRI